MARPPMRRAGHAGKNPENPRNTHATCFCCKCYAARCHLGRGAGAKPRTAAQVHLSELACEAEQGGVPPRA